MNKVRISTKRETLKKNHSEVLELKDIITELKDLSEGLNNIRASRRNNLQT